MPLVISIEWPPELLNAILTHQSSSNTTNYYPKNSDLISHHETLHPFSTETQILGCCFERFSLEKALGQSSPTIALPTSTKSYSNLCSPRLRDSPSSARLLQIGVEGGWRSHIENEIWRSRSLVEDEANDRDSLQRRCNREDYESTQSDKSSNYRLIISNLTRYNLRIGMSLYWIPDTWIDLCNLCPDSGFDRLVLSIALHPKSQIYRLEANLVLPLLCNCCLFFNTSLHLYIWLVCVAYHVGFKPDYIHLLSVGSSLLFEAKRRKISSKSLNNIWCPHKFVAKNLGSKNNGLIHFITHLYTFLCIMVNKTQLVSSKLLQLWVSENFPSKFCPQTKLTSTMEFFGLYPDIFTLMVQLLMSDEASWRLRTTRSTSRDASIVLLSLLIQVSPVDCYYWCMDYHYYLSNNANLLSIVEILYFATTNNCSLWNNRSSCKSFWRIHLPKYATSTLYLGTCASHSQINYGTLLLVFGNIYNFISMYALIYHFNSNYKVQTDVCFVNCKLKLASSTLAEACYESEVMLVLFFIFCLVVLLSGFFSSLFGLVVLFLCRTVRLYCLHWRCRSHWYHRVGWIGDEGECLWRVCVLRFDGSALGVFLFYFYVSSSLSFNKL